MTDAPDTTFPAITSLAALREAVLDRSVKRMPIWRLRFKPDVVLSIQPKPCSILTQGALARGVKQYTVCFECKAVCVEGGATVEHLDQTPRDGRAYWHTKFVIRDATPDIWEIRWTRWGWSSKAHKTKTDDLKASLLAACRSDKFNKLTPRAMLRPQCLICGKALTDPASMARWIGPECSNNGSLRVPFLIIAVDAP